MGTRGLWKTYQDDDTGTSSCNGGINFMYDSCHSNLTGYTLEACVELVLIVIFRNKYSKRVNSCIFQQANPVDCAIVLIAMQYPATSLPLIANTAYKYCCSFCWEYMVAIQLNLIQLISLYYYHCCHCVVCVVCGAFYFSSNADTIKENPI